MLAPSYVKQITNGNFGNGSGGSNVALMWNRTVEWDDKDWRQLAACRSTEPDLFFPIGTTGPAIDQIEAAKRVCRGCDAMEPCLDFALATNQESGVWGGTSEEERRKLRKVWLAARRRAS
jgi:WhiB family transcriptional regulator, redox-sensing transcriptional regulator